MIPDAYYVVQDFGKIGRETVINWERCSKQNIIDDILSGQYDHPVEVHCINREDGKWSDQSEDIARDVLCNAFYDHQELKGPAADFVERYIPDELDETRAEYASAKTDYDEHSTLNKAQQGV